MAKTPYYLHRLAKSQGKTPEELVEAAIEKALNPNAAAELLGVSSDTVYHFIEVRGWTIKQCAHVIKPEGQAS